MLLKEPGQRALVAGITSLIGTLMLCVAGIDILTFIMPASTRTGMSGMWDAVKLGWMAALCMTASVFYGVNAWRIFQPSSRQRRLADQWSPLAMLLWWGAGALGLLVNYPLPYFVHHVDKFFLFLGLVLGWGAWLCVHPVSLDWWLESGSYRWLRTVMINAVVFLVLAESVMRLADPVLARNGLFNAAYQTPGGGIPHQVVDGSIKRTNSMGFRDRERILARTSSAPRVLALGDSFTWGAGVSYDDTFVTLVERGLQRYSPEAEVVNLGLVGYQPEEYLSLLRAHGLGYQPDLVLVNFYVGNDFMPVEGALMTVAGQRHRVHVNGNWFHDHVSWDHWYLSHNLAYASLFGRAWIRHAMGQSDLGLWNSALGNHNDHGKPAPFPGWSRQYLRSILGTGDLYLAQDTDAFRARWDETRVILEKLDAVLRERGIPWILIILPAEIQVDQKLQRLYLEMLKEVPEQYDFDKPQHLLRDWSRRRGVRLIDLAPQFRADVGNHRLYITNDCHWNENGHALAASAILHELRFDLAQARQRLQGVSGP
jgi:lysophospholipase L1-like esterase